MFSSCLCYFQHLKKQFSVRTKMGGGGGGGVSNFFFRKTILFHFAFHAFFKIKKKGNIEKCPFTYWLNGRWFLQIVDRDNGNLYPIYPRAIPLF